MASIDDEDALTRALEGAQGAYLLWPPEMAAEDLITQKRALVESVAAGQGKLPTFLPPDLVVPMVATKDIGLVAAKATAPLAISRRCSRRSSASR